MENNKNLSKIFKKNSPRPLTHLMTHSRSASKKITFIGIHHLSHRLVEPRSRADSQRQLTKNEDVVAMQRNLLNQQ